MHVHTNSAESKEAYSFANVPPSPSPSPRHTHRCALKDLSPNTNVTSECLLQSAILPHSSWYEEDVMLIQGAGVFLGSSGGGGIPCSVFSSSSSPLADTNFPPDLEFVHGTRNNNEESGLSECTASDTVLVECKVF